MSEDSDIYGLDRDAGINSLDNYTSYANYTFPPGQKKKRAWLKKLGFFLLGSIGTLIFSYFLSIL